jgi:diguanylate cyclase (GGDEF)-like protein/PAS domain S-box-containing protein
VALVLRFHLPAVVSVTQLDTRRTTNFQRVSKGTAAAVLVIGSLTLVGQVPAIGALISTAPELGTVRATTTLLILLCGLGLWLAEGRSNPFRRWCARLCAAPVVGVGVLALGVAVDSAFWAHGRLAGVLSTVSLVIGGTLPAGTALSLIALAIALLFLDVETAGGRRPSQILALIVVLASFVIMLAYSYGAEPIYRLINPSPFYVAASLGTLGVGILAASPNGSLMRLIISDSAGGRMIRYVPAALMAGALVLGWLALEVQRAGLWDATLTLSVFVVLNMALTGLVIAALAASFDRAERSRRRAEQAVQASAARHAGVASLGQKALSGLEPDRLLREAVALVAGILEVEFCEVLEACDEDLLILRACTGWRDDDLDDAIGRPLPHPVAHYALTTGVPVVLEDLTRDARFTKPLPERLLAAASGMAVVVPLQTRARSFGVLAIYTRERRCFGRDDIDLLQPIAAVLGSAIDRARTDEALRRSEAKFANVFRSCPDSISLTTVAEGRFVDVNTSFLQLTGYTRGEVIGRTSSELLLWAHGGDREKLVEHSRTGKGRAGLEADFRTKSGELRSSLCFTELVTLGDDECLLTLARDISDSKRVEAMTEEANDHLRQSVTQLERQTREICLLNDMSDLLQSCVTIAEASTIVVQFARKLFPNAAGALYLLSDDGSVFEAVGSWGDLAPEPSLFTPSDCWALRRGRAHVVSDEVGNGDDELTAGLRCPHLTTPRPVFSICVPMMAQNETLGLLHMRRAVGRPDAESPALASVSEAGRRLAVTLAEHAALAMANLKLRDTLRSQSIRDQLTGLLNRRYMEEALDRELRRASRSRAPLGLVLLDVDRLKHVNDVQGHEAGDKLLQTVSRFLQQRTREDDVLCRLGGDEFVIVMPGASVAVAQDRAQQLLIEIRRVVIDFSGQSDFVPSFSIGLAGFPEHAATGPGLLRAADLALYRAKAAGRDRLAVGQQTE